MDKQKVKIILIALAVLLAIFLLYRVASKASDNKLDLANKKANAEADLDIFKAQDEYADERLELKKSEVENKVVILSEKQKALGYETLSEYLNSLSNEERTEYEVLSTIYIDAMGVDPDMMSLTQLRLWKEKYDLFDVYRDYYGSLTGQDVDIYEYINDPDDLKILADKVAADIDYLLEKAFTDECELFHADVQAGTTGKENLIGVPGSYIDNAMLRAVFAHPSDIALFHADLTDQARAWEDRKPLLDSAYTRLKKYFTSDWYHWKTSLKVAIDGVNDLPADLYTVISSFRAVDFAYMSKKLKDEGGLQMWSRLGSNRAPHDKKTYYSFYEAAVNLANINYQAKTNKSFVLAVATVGVSLWAQNKTTLSSYIPSKINALMYRLEAAYNQVPNKFGDFDKDGMNTACNYAQRLYGFGDAFWYDLYEGKTTIQDFTDSDSYKKSATYQQRGEFYDAYDNLIINNYLNGN